MSPRHAPTIADIARLARVSKSTVSRALNGSPLISAATTERVQAIARERNFLMNAPARQLSRRESRTIAFALHAFNNHFSIADLFVLEVLGGISNALNEAGYDLLILQVDPRDTVWIHTYLGAGRVDGFILLSSAWKQRAIRALLEVGAPFAVWGAPPPDQAVCSVGGDNFTGGKLAAGHLIQAGRRRVAFLGGPAEELEMRQRFEGFQAGMRAGGLEADPARVTYEEYRPDAGAAGMQRLLARAPELDAVFVTSDLMAIEALKTLREAGRRVPDDVAVVGYDDLSIAELSHPALTTIRQNIPQGGRLLAENLLGLLRGEPARSVILPVELIPRQSA